MNYSVPKTIKISAYWTLKISQFHFQAGNIWNGRDEDNDQNGQEQKLNEDGFFQEEI